MYKETVNNKDVVSVVLQRGGEEEWEGNEKNFHVIYLASFWITGEFKVTFHHFFIPPILNSIFEAFETDKKHSASLGEKMPLSGFQQVFLTFLVFYNGRVVRTSIIRKEKVCLEDWMSKTGATFGRARFILYRVLHSSYLKVSNERVLQGERQETQESTGLKKED